MLEAFQSLREELTTKKKPEVESLFPASKPGTSSDNAAHLDLPPPRSSTNVQTEAMDVDYGPALPPRLVLNQDTWDQYVAPSEVLPKKVSYSHKKHYHRQPVDPGSASDQLHEDSGSLLTDLKSTLTRANTNPGPDMCHLLQRKISLL